MNKRLTDARRAALEARYMGLKAALEPGKVSNIVDAVGTEQADIKSVVERIMSLMNAEDGTGKYHTATKRRLEAALRLAFDGVPAKEEGESPEEEAQDLHDPAMHMVEDLEHEVQTMDDAHLQAEVEQLEADMKADLAGEKPDQMGHHETGHEISASHPTYQQKADNQKLMDSSKMTPEPFENKTISKNQNSLPGMSPENHMALLLSMPSNARRAKAASLRALAGVLDADEREVSGNNEMSYDAEGDSLANDYEKEEDGSMKDVHAKKAALKNTLRSLIANAETEDDKKEDDDKEDDKKDGMEVAAVLKLAMKHLLASIEDEDDKKDDKKDDECGPDCECSDCKENDKEDDKELPAFLKKDEASLSMEARRAILKTRLASLRKTAMDTPKEVPSPSGTSEDSLKGDAKIQYQNALGDTNMSEIQLKKQKIPTDKASAGEANELYMSNAPTSPDGWMTSEKDSSKDVNNKRVLKDEGVAVQKSTPASPNEQMEMGAGSHQKTLDWESEKSKSDMTPGGDRLKGLAELVQARTSRAMKLAQKMATAGLIKTEAQLTEQVVKLASMDDEVFKQVATFFESSNLTKRAGEVPEQFKAHEGDPDDKKAPFEKDEDKEDEEDDKPAFLKKEEASRSIRRASRNDDVEEDNSRELRSTASRGLKSALNLGGLDTPSSKGSPIFNKLASLNNAWTTPEQDADKLAEIDRMLGR